MQYVNEAYLRGYKSPWQHNRKPLEKPNTCFSQAMSDELYKTRLNIYSQSHCVTLKTSLKVSGIYRVMNCDETWTVYLTPLVESHYMMLSWKLCRECIPIYSCALVPSAESFPLLKVLLLLSNIILLYFVSAFCCTIMKELSIYYGHIIRSALHLFYIQSCISWM